MSEVNKTLEVNFDEPIKFAGQEYYSITLKEPTIGQFEKAMQAKTEVGMVIDLVSVVAVVPRKVVEQIPQSKLMEISNFLAQFGNDSR